MTMDPQQMAAGIYDSANRRARELVALGTSFNDLELTETENDCVDLGVKAGITACIQELQAHGLLAGTEA